MNPHLRMTTGRLVALIIGVPIVLSLIAAAAVGGVAYAGQGTYPVLLPLPRQAAAVELSVTRGDLTVGQFLSGRLALTGAVRYSLLPPVVMTHATQSRVAVSARCPLPFGVCAARYRLALPVGTALTVTDDLGDITVTGLTSEDVTAIDQSGNITLIFAMVPRQVQVSDQLGDVTLVLPAGPTAYRVTARAALGAAAVRVPTSRTSANVITVTDTSGNIVVR